MQPILDNVFDILLLFACRIILAAKRRFNEDIGSRVNLMLKIRNEQLEALTQVQRTAFVDRLIHHLASEYPSWFAEHQAQGVREFVERVLDVGESNNIRGKGAVALLAELMVEFGEDLNKSSDGEWAAGIMAHSTLPDQLKVDILAERLRQRSGGRRIIEIEAKEAN